LNSFVKKSVGKLEDGSLVNSLDELEIDLIKDSGIGVSREDLSVLFSKFKQLKSFDSTRKGTGLGLVVSKGIVEAHGGEIWAESAGENMGSTFSFSLPL
jgi:signal transduction histidine kinase